MAMSAIEAVKQVASGASSNYLDAVQAGDALFQQYEITTPLRMAHFLAQALHETGGFKVLRERMNYSAARLVEVFGVNVHSARVTPEEAAQLAGNEEAIAERVYGLYNPSKARELGNVQPGDGFRYRGNGVLQTTGRGNHRKAGVACGVDFEADPDAVTAPEHALKPALFEWGQGNLNAYADQNDIRHITRRINGGYNGFLDRQKWLERLWPLLKDDDQSADVWLMGDEDQDVAWFQQALNTLGAQPPLAVDGRYRPATTQAVMAFQKTANLTPDGIAGPATKKAIEQRL